MNTSSCLSLEKDVGLNVPLTDILNLEVLIPLETFNTNGDDKPIVQSFKYSEVMYQPAMTGEVAQVTYYNATSMRAILTAGHRSFIPSWKYGEQEKYKRYLVLKSLIRVTFVSRENTEPVFVCVAPVDGVSQFQRPMEDYKALVAYPNARTAIIPPARGGRRIKILTIRALGQNIFGSGYLTNLNYSGFCGKIKTTNPLSMMYWAVAAYCPMGFTYGGGYQIQVSIANKVKLFDKYEIVNVGQLFDSLSKGDQIQNVSVKEINRAFYNDSSFKQKRIVDLSVQLFINDVGSSRELRVYHNEVKKMMYKLFAKGLSLVDYGSGRGGDLMKWHKAAASGDLEFVKCIDFSKESLNRLEDRYFSYKSTKDKIFEIETMEMDFEVMDRPIGDDFESASCMFALHYAFGTLEILRRFIKYVSDNLVYGGFFFGIVPDGQRILQLMEKYGMKVNLPCLKIGMWGGVRPSLFGTPYVISITDTILVADQVDRENMGSIEYLVSLPMLEGVCKEFGLEPMIYYPNELNMKLDPMDESEVFKHFYPHFQNNEYNQASALYATFVFQKH